jgi:DNA-binding CsgD family transcriptional regulator
LQRLTGKARAAGALGVLAHELYVLSDLEFRTGRWGSSAANATEAANMARDTGNAFSLHYALGILALIAAAKGRAADCRMYVAEALDVAQRMDIDHRYISDAIGLLELGLGHPEEAIRHLEPANRVAPEDSKPASALVVRPSVPDLFEAYVRAARPLPTQLQNALAAAEQLEFPVMRAAEKFCRALIADDVDYDDLYNDALRLHQEMHMPFAKARTALCYGERLRRDGRRVQARIQLRAAIQVFERLGATPWIDRAANELRATGETVRTRKAPAAEALTAQELQIAQIVARGATNRETAATLFLSPKTIEVHLGRVYRKLAVRSRTELSLAMQGGLEDTR